MHLFEYKATFALNNMAITMMQRSCCNQAFETFKGAVTALQTATEGADAQGHQLVRNKLKQAIHHATNPEQCDFFVPSLNVIQHDADLSFVQRICAQSKGRKSNRNSIHADEMCLDDETPTSSTCTSPFTLIRLREDDKHLHHRSELNFLTAIVLHNFAVASLLKAECSKGTIRCDECNCLHQNASKSDQDAIVILHLARNLLDDDIAAANDRSFEATSPLAFSRVILISAIVLQALVQALEAHGNSDEAFTCIVRLTQIRTVASVLSDKFLHPIQAQSAFAPAA